MGAAPTALTDTIPLTHPIRDWRIKDPLHVSVGNRGGSVGARGASQHLHADASHLERGAGATGSVTSFLVRFLFQVERLKESTLERNSIYIGEEAFSMRFNNSQLSHQDDH